MNSSYKLIRGFRPTLSANLKSLCRYGSNVPSQNRTYDDALSLLNTCQTPYETLKALRNSRAQNQAKTNGKIKACLLHLGYSLSDLDSLNIVHVAGTKGKGSTCAFVNSILNRYRVTHGEPLKVGLYTSPHLISVRERIKIDSTPISPEKFTKYFFQVWDCLEKPFVKNDGTSAFFEKPVYFRFLTLLSYHVFLQEGVNTAIYEVGVGGEYDSTNIVQNPAVTGISTIGIDHTFTLGEKITDIAWHKAGILKKNCPNFSVNQEPDVLDVINKRSQERQVRCSKIIKTLPQIQNVMVRPNAEFQKQNATLAVYLSDTVLKRLVKDYDYTLTDSNPLPTSFVDGLEQMVFKGRCEKKEEGILTWYLDGAHNSNSIKVAAAWFANELSKSIQSDSQKGLQVLIFNQQGHREVFNLLENLFSETCNNQLQFDHVIFCPTIPRENDAKKGKDFINLSTDKKAIEELTLQKQFAEKWKVLDRNRANVHVLQSLEESIDLSRRLSNKAPRKSNIFITGSIHLVGRALSILEGEDSL